MIGVKCLCVAFLFLLLAFNGFVYYSVGKTWTVEHKTQLRYMFFWAENMSDAVRNVGYIRLFVEWMRIPQYDYVNMSYVLYNLNTSDGVEKVGVSLAVYGISSSTRNNYTDITIYMLYLNVPTVAFIFLALTQDDKKKTKNSKKKTEANKTEPEKENAESRPRVIRV